MLTTRIIQIFNRVPDGEGYVNLIAECNDIDENNNIVRQLSRSKFKFQEVLTDGEIIDMLTTNQYSRYFS